MHVFESGIILNQEYLFKTATIVLRNSCYQFDVPVPYVLFTQQRLWKCVLYYCVVLWYQIGDYLCSDARSLDSKQGQLNTLDLFEGSGGVPLSYILRVIFPI